MGFQKRMLCDTLSQQFSDALTSQFCQLCFVRLGIIEEFAADETLAIAHQPHFASQSAKENNRSTKPFLRMRGHATDGKAKAIVLPYHLRNPHTELMATGICRHTTDISANQQHRIAAVADPGDVFSKCLGSAAVDNGNKVICDDQAVFAFLCGALRNDTLFYYLHIIY